jgi:hypothetical protein
MTEESKSHVLSMFFLFGGFLLAMIFAALVVVMSDTSFVSQMVGCVGSFMLVISMPVFALGY